MKIDDNILKKYIDGADSKNYSDCWIYKFGSENKFEEPDPVNIDWVKKLSKKLTAQILDFKPRNFEVLEKLFPDFQDVVNSYTVMLVVGFPYPYDAMVLENEGKEYMVFDLIQFGEDSLRDDFSCHGLLTHELIHMCLHNKYPDINNKSYLEKLDFIAFDEGFAHALSYAEDFNSFQFDDLLEEKYLSARSILREAVIETNEGIPKLRRISR